MRRLTDEELFRIGPSGLEEVSDDTIRERLDASRRPGQPEPNELTELLYSIAMAANRGMVR